MLNDALFMYVTSSLRVDYTDQNVSLSPDRLFRSLATFYIKFSLTFKKILFWSNTKITVLVAEDDVAPRCYPLFSNTLSHFMFPVCVASNLFDAD